MNLSADATVNLLDPVEISGVRTGLLGQVESNRGVRLLATHGMPNGRITNHITANTTALVYTPRMPADAMISRRGLPLRSVAPLGLITPGQSYLLRGNGPFMCLYCVLGDEFIASLSGAASGLRINKLDLVTAIESTRLTYMCAQMLREVIEPGFAGKLFAESMGILAAVEIARCDGVSQLEGRHRLTGLSPAQLRRFDSYIHDGRSEKMTLSDLSVEFNIGQRDLLRLVRQAKGVSLHRWIADHRFAEARRLLTDTDWTIEHIARRCDFQSASAFSAAFKTAAGVAPHEYRRMVWTDDD
jgi:AraC-like DNA-binding protein